MELDDLKSAWKSIPEQQTYNKTDIFNMLKRKSSSTIKWLFTFTLFEFIIVLLFTITSVINGKIITSLSSFDNLSSYNNYITGSIISIIITLIFLFVIYKHYKKINVNNSISELSKQIIKFRKMVNLFIFIIIFSLLIISIPYYYNIGQELYITKFSEDFSQSKANIIGIIAVIIALVFLIIISAIYYLVIYFFFLRKLSKNLKQLNEII